MRASSGPGQEGGTAERATARGLLSELVALAPVNLEDPVRGRFEKANYSRTAEYLARTARGWGLDARIYDPTHDGGNRGAFRGIPRPNVIVDLDAGLGAGSKGRVLILAHYDVVPVPAEQVARWRSPPHTLTERPDGRWYGRGSNDDLGSGVVASLLALRRLRTRGAPRPVRLVLCCDEETGGAGGIEALKAHDARLDARDAERILAADVCLIPDGSPYVAAGSSGLLFLDGTFEGSASLAETLEYGRILVELHDMARGWKSRYASPDWPARGAPEPVITGRATVTRFDFDATAQEEGSRARLRTAHAETDASNVIARSVTLVFDAPGEFRGPLETALARGLGAGFSLEPAGSTALDIPEGALARAVVGESHHAGYPHRARNPVPAALTALGHAVREHVLEGTTPGRAVFGVDLRLVPEMAVADALEAAFRFVRQRTSRDLPRARLEAPADRQRGGYALDPAHPMAVRLASLLADRFGAAPVYGEYGGTDASALADVRTPAGVPLPALVFGSMDAESRIHEAEESVDPRLLGAVTDTIVAFVREA